VQGVYDQCRLTMGEIISFHEVRSSNLLKLDTLNGRVDRRRSYVLRQLAKPNSYIQTRIRLIGGEVSPFEQALRLDDQNDPRAKDWYRKAIEQSEATADAWCNLGILESGSGWKNRAKHCFLQAIRLEPRHFDAQFHLANLYFDTGDLVAAKLHYELAQDVSDDYPPLLYQLGSLLLMEQQYGAAIKIFRKYASLVDDVKRDRVRALIRKVRSAVAMDGT
jgi:tetratricopeptide (TPR) repeat protein